MHVRGSSKNDMRARPGAPLDGSARMHVIVSAMASTETRKQRIARQLAELMERHSVTDTAEYERIIKNKGLKPALDQVTIRRILGAKAKSDEGPKLASLKVLAQAFNETVAQAFPEEGSAVVEVLGQKVAFSGAEGALTPRTVEAIQEAMRRYTVERAEKVHALKKRPK